MRHDSPHRFERPSGDGLVHHDLASLWLEVTELLSRAKGLLDEDIGAYPKPIPRCDAQFNHLIEQRVRIAAMLAHVDGMPETLATFRDSGPLTQDPEEQRLRERVAALLPPALPARRGGAACAE
jgi:hypothetical protein